MNLSYPYIKADLIAAPERYFYTSLHGVEFFQAYSATRKAALDQLDRMQPMPQVTRSRPNAEVNTWDLLEKPTDIALDKLIKRFEITRKIYPGYDSRLVTGTGDPADPALYARLALRIGERVDHNARLSDLNVLLKLVDLVISRLPDLSETAQSDARQAIEYEQRAIENLLQSQGLADAI